MMTIDQPCPLETMLDRFGACLKEAAQRRLLERDGLDYINGNANNGANDPAEPTQSSVKYVVTYETKTGFCGDYLPRTSCAEAIEVATAEVKSSTGYKATIHRVTVEVVAEFECCGHA